MKQKDIKKMTTSQATKDIDKLKKDLFNFRFQVANGQLKSSSKINDTKKNIARLKTLIRGKVNA
jgi:large subunit ribosomal protein L29|tara:strand:+ start:442 stop:633 length:192 start_codon:yes stop_codon:yes gene_type:complete